MTAHPPVVLVPRGGGWGDHVADLLTAQGMRPWIVPVIRTELAQGDELDSARRDLAAGGFDWVAITSAAAVAALPATVRARIATVGPATARAARQAGYAVEMVPPGPDYSAEAMLHTWQPAGRVLLLRSDLAATTLADGLRSGGVTVTDVVAYRTVPAALSPEQRGHLAAGRADVALVTSGSVARALAAAGLAASTQGACLGPRTAEAAREAGLRVDVVADRQQVEVLVAAVRDLIGDSGTEQLEPHRSTDPGED
ncbi:MAG TPA: uroporphyrinogen-III synthase [Ruania sp.]|nr:uroporphyrinogen-III synthase [Ruania sp.]